MRRSTAKEVKAPKHATCGAIKGWQRNGLGVKPAVKTINRWVGNHRAPISQEPGDAEQRFHVEGANEGSLKEMLTGKMQ